MKILLFQLDGRLPNLALMRISAHHKERGDSVTFRRAANLRSVEPDLYDHPDAVYASLIFQKSRPVAEKLLETYPRAVIGGTGWDLRTTLEDSGISTPKKDYDLYPGYRQSIGFTQRGCRLACGFCVVPKKEGKPKREAFANEIWRGDPWPRELVLLDNDFFGEKDWPKQIETIRDGGFKVNFNQGINARFLNDETAAAISTVDYRNADMTDRRLYTAWDNARDESRLFRGLEALVRYGVKPRNIMVYILLGYWKWSGFDDWEYRRKKLREFGVVPYPMPYLRDRLSIGFQRWVVGAYDKQIPWAEWEAAGMRPQNLQRR